MSSSRRPAVIAAIVAAIVLAAACQPVPQPFRSATPEAVPLAKPTRQAGLLVRAVPGAPEPVALAEAVAAALRDRDVNATTLGGNRRSYLLTGQARRTPAGGDRVTVTLDWLISDPRGAVAGRHAQTAEVPAAAWDGGDGGLIGRLADAAAAALAPIMADARAPAAAEPALAVYGVDGAPGDGNVSLRRALGYALAQRGFRVVDGLEGADVVISGAVDVTPIEGGFETIRIVWSALHPDGREIGTVRQSNRVAAHSLHRHWGLTALDVAEAAVPGLARLVAGARAAPAESPDGDAGDGTDSTAARAVTGSPERRP